jgi:hypothetical protein
VRQDLHNTQTTKYKGTILKIVNQQQRQCEKKTTGTGTRRGIVQKEDKESIKWRQYSAKKHI